MEETEKISQDFILKLRLEGEGVSYAKSQRKYIQTQRTASSDVGPKAEELGLF